MTDTIESREGLLETVSKYRSQIMGFAALWIFFFHVRNEAVVFQNVPVLKDIDTFFVNIGFCGVDIFLFLSGWGMYHAVNRHSLTVFYKRRYRRLVFPFLVSCIFLAFNYKWGLLRFVKAVTGWTFMTKDVYEVIWFIPAISILYLFFPLYRRLFDKASCKYVFTVAAVALWFALAVAGTLLSDRTDIYLFVNRIPVFIIGVLFGWMTYIGKKRLGRYAWFILAVMLIAGFQLQYYFAFKKVNLLLPLGRNGLPAILIGIAMCFVSGFVFKLLGKVTFIQKAYGFLGKMTLEFYAAQDIAIRLLKEMIVRSGVPFNSYLYVLLTFLLTFGIAYLLYLINRLISGKMDKKPVFAK